jgi:SAM-dependent methyltransferase
VRYLEHAGHVNRGMSASRNLGIRHGDGTYVAFLDADDVWLPHKLEEQVGYLEANPEVALVYGLYEIWYSWTGRPEDRGRDFAHLLGVPSGEPIRPPSLLKRFFFDQDAALPAPTDFLVRRSAIDDVGGFEDAFVGLYEDEVFVAKICLHHTVMGIDTVWDRYRQHPDSSNARMVRSRQEYAARRVFLSWLRDYLRSEGVADPAIVGGLRREMWRTAQPLLFRLWDGRRTIAPKMLGRLLPAPVRSWLRARWHGVRYVPPPGWARFGSFGPEPISRTFGFERGQPVDRFYIERFLEEQRDDIRGRVLEVADATYTRRYGGERVTRSDVISVDPDTPQATIRADLADAGNIAPDTFDCVILTQTLQYIYPVEVAVRTVQRILKPGGVVLATLPGICQISRYDADRWGQYWAFTSMTAARLFGDVFGPGNVRVEAHGNVLAATALLYGLASRELRPADLASDDPDYEVIVTVRAVKA